MTTDIAYCYGILYCRINKNIAVIFDICGDKNINMEIINVWSNNKYDITHFITKYEVLHILNEWILKIEYNINSTSSEYYNTWKWKQFLSQAYKLRDMITGYIETEKYINLLNQVEHDELFTIKMVDTEKDKEAARKLEKEKLKEKYKERLLARRKAKNHCYNKYHKQLAELQLSKKEGYHCCYIYHPEYPELDGLKGYHIDNDMVCTSMTKIMDAYNEYCQSEDYYL